MKIGMFESFIKIVCGKLWELREFLFIFAFTERSIFCTAFDCRENTPHPN